MAYTMSKESEDQLVYFLDKDKEIISGWNKGIFQKSYVIDPSPMVGGHNGGTISHSIMLIESIDRFYEVPVSSVVKDINILIKILERGNKSK